MGLSLTFLKQMARGLAVQFGENCEIVIHDLSLENIEHSIVHVENGHVSNRNVGDGPSRIVLESLHENAESLNDRLGYLTKTADGRILKSSTLFYRDDSGQVKYIFSINYDITNLMLLDNAIKPLISCDQPEGRDNNPIIPKNVNELLDELLEQSVALVGRPAAVMSKEDKITAIKFLNDAGAFLITKSGDKVAKYFGISKYTLYSYIDVNK